MNGSFSTLVESRKSVNALFLQSVSWCRITPRTLPVNLSFSGRDSVKKKLTMTDAAVRNAGAISVDCQLIASMRYAPTIGDIRGPTTPITTVSVSILSRIDASKQSFMSAVEMTSMPPAATP